MKTLTTLLLLAALPAFAAEPTDAPKVDLDAPGRALILEQGTITPYAGVLLDPQEDVSRERARARCTAELADAKSNAWLSPPVLVALIVGGLVVGASVGAGVTLALKK